MNFIVQVERTTVSSLIFSLFGTVLVNVTRFPTIHNCLYDKQNLQKRTRQSHVSLVVLYFSLVKSSGDHGDQTVLGNMTSESSAEESL